MYLLATVFYRLLVAGTPQRPYTIKRVRLPLLDRHGDDNLVNSLQCVAAQTVACAAISAVAWHAEPMCTCRPRNANCPDGGLRRRQPPRDTPARISALVAAVLCAVLVFPGCARAAFEQQSAQSSRLRSIVASTDAVAATDAGSDTAAADGCGLRLRLVGEGLHGSAGTHVQSSIIAAVQDAYQAAFHLPAEVAVVPAKAIGGASTGLLPCCCAHKQYPRTAQTCHALQEPQNNAHRAAAAVACL